MKKLFALLMALCGLLSLPAFAHEVRPAYVRIVETAPDHWDVTWTQPVMGERAVRLTPHLSNGWLARTPSHEELTATHYLRGWSIDAPASELDGARLSVDGLAGTITDVIVHVRTRGGKGADTILRPDRSSMNLSLSQPSPPAVPAYFRLGVGHILSGLDHLAFVAGLVLLVRSGRRLVGAVTAFTVAHSLTLAAGTLGWVQAPTATIEALIAWSVLFLAFELTRRDGGAQGITARLPWIAAFAFGLLHGFGFAGALAETGLPHTEIPMALLLFNLGVEAGQLLFVGVLLGAAWLWRRAARADWRGIEPLMLRRIAPYGLGCYAGFLFVERTARVFA
ncbi:HupE/UreJ family protein [Novosphingobium beihaiensis]|uniref:HupE/UreJ family protein n=1 Tax=Novosphingobium beihaiensis TaxID=2930389 RepID=A0ABT0BLX0_9SPHN|nr:HupE/UreJ family protein [Novosphingobium beihaiensis]MCJ2186027.1 HupE/UreJ family protein [Novosphingobium beihaiensis]